MSLAALAHLARGWEWLWRGRAMSEARAREATGDLRVLQQQRARIAAEIAEHVLESPGPWRAGSAEALAAALFAESIGWSLRTLSPAPAAGELSRPPSSDELRELLDGHEARLATLLATDSVGLAPLRRHLLERDFEDCSTPSATQRQAAHDLASTARILLKRTGNQRSEVDALSWQRTWRAITALGLLSLACSVPLMTRDWRERRADLAAHRPWTTSSSYTTVCRSPERHCQSASGFFFHTKEEDKPWLELDLGRAQRMSAVRVINRSDCCEERSVPLVVEVSSDHREWREVVRRTERFASWRADFAPTTARWVRFRADRRTFLHFRDVRVLD